MLTLSSPLYLLLLISRNSQIFSCSVKQLDRGTYVYTVTNITNIPTQFHSSNFIASSGTFGFFSFEFFNLFHVGKMISYITTHIILYTDNRNVLHIILLHIHKFYLTLLDYFYIFTCFTYLALKQTQTN